MEKLVLTEITKSCKIDLYVLPKNLRKFLLFLLEKISVLFFRRRNAFWEHYQAKSLWRERAGKEPAMQEAVSLRPFGMRDKIGYALGDLGCNFSFSLISNYMFLFYTQCVGLTTENWAWIIVVSKVWDAVNDILVGGMVDHKHLGKKSKSKFMPWIRIGSLLLSAFMLLLFLPVDSFSQAGKAAWCLIVYGLYTTAYTMVNVPYGSLHSVITEDPKQRTSLSTFRSIGAGVAVVLIMLLPQVVYVDNVLSGKRMFLVAAVFALFSFAAIFAMQRMVTERAVRTDTTEKVRYVSTLKSFFTNRALLAITIATFAVVAFHNSSASVNNLVFQFYFRDAGKSTLAMLASYIPLVALMPFASTIVGKIGKKRFIVIGGFGSTLAGLLMLLLPITPDTKGMVLYIAGLMLVNIGGCVFQVIVWAIVADCIELSYRKKGVREEGSLYAIYSFFRNLAQGVGSAVVALSLKVVGYNETAAVQTDAVASNIKTLYIVLLIAGLAILTLAMQFIYNIDKKQEQAFAKAE